MYNYLIVINKLCPNAIIHNDAKDLCAGGGTGARNASSGKLKTATVRLN